MTYNCSVDLLSNLDWQRSNAPKVKALIRHMQEWMEVNHCQFWNDWVRDVFTLETANDFGLSVWAIILDETIAGTTKASPQDYEDFGFGPDRFNFDNGNFGTNSDAGYNFNTEEKRALLKLKAFILHMNGSVQQINQALGKIFGEGIVCIDNLDMSFTYIVYDDNLNSIIREIYSRDLLPRPACIKISVVLNDVVPFGFSENNENFGNGNFNSGAI